MPEEKGYLDIQAEGGKIRVSYAAVGEIAAEAALSVPGVGGLANASSSVVKGVEVELSEIGICTISVHILVRLGSVVSQVAKSVQSVVKTAVDGGVGIEVAAVNVFVAGIAVK